MLRGAQPNRQDPVGDRALDDSPGHDATLGSRWGLPRGLGRGGRAVVGLDKVVDVVRSHDPLPVLKYVRLKRHGGRGVEIGLDAEFEFEAVNIP